MLPGEQTLVGQAMSHLWYKRHQFEVRKIEYGKERNRAELRSYRFGSQLQTRER
jgi:hypothetical protein